MLVGREEQLSILQKNYGKLNSSIIVLYGKTGMGKTTLATTFAKDKDTFYYSALPAASDEIKYFMANSVYGPSELNGYLDSYEDIFIGMTKDNKVKKVIIIDEFTNISRNDNSFLEAAFNMVKNQKEYGRVMLILVSSSISYIEANKDKMFKNMNSFTTFMKINELSFMDTMHFFANYSIDDCVRFFGLTGGVPLYISKLSKKMSFTDNICKNVIGKGAFLREEGHNFIKEELRETALYNTILGCLAKGMNKINDIYNYTGFGRDKISVYIKNLMERDIVEKVYSYDESGRETIKKGCYRIAPGYIEFWYKYIYPNHTMLMMQNAQDFYKNNIEDSLDAFVEEAFINVCSEYMNLLEAHGDIAFATVKTSRSYEKEARIDIIRIDETGSCVVGLCDFGKEAMNFKKYEKLLKAVRDNNIKVTYTFLFARSGFSDEIQKVSKDDKSVLLVDIKDL